MSSKHKDGSSGAASGQGSRGNTLHSGDSPPDSAASGQPQTVPHPSTILTSDIVTSPEQYRATSPTRVFRPPMALQSPQGSGTTSPTPSRLPTPASTASTLKTPRPIQLTDGQNRASTVPSQDTSGSDSTNRQRTTSPLRPSPLASPRPSISSLRLQTDVESDDLDNTPKASRMMAPSPSTERTSRSPHPPQSTTISGAKVPRNYSSIGSTLETVEEGDQVGSPFDEPLSNTSSTVLERQLTMSSPSVTPPELRSLESSQDMTESEADYDRSRDRGRQSHNKPVTQSQPPPLSKSKQPAGKARSTHETTNSMIVETETVPSIPQTTSSLIPDKNGPSSKKDEAGSVRAKPSSETIRPKKERRKVVQKRPSVVSGSKAEMFEAKVASAADDDDSELDETFVYESNPPEPRLRQNRHHSRTPSGTSIQSMGDRRHGARTISSVLDGHRGPKAKRSMKFSSSTFVAGSGDEDSSRDYGTARAQKPRPTRLDDPQNHHGPWASSDWTPNGPDSPFSAASKSRFSNPNSARQSPRNTPRHSPPPYSLTPNKKQLRASVPPSFDQSRTLSEQHPLMGSLRAQRTRPLRRPQVASLRDMDYLEIERRPWTRRCSGCLVLMIFVFVLVLVGAVALFVSTQPLYDVKLFGIQNILASEEELMLDLNVAAVNPNIFTISTLELDVNVFAKSRYVGTQSQWRDHHDEEPVGLQRVPFRGQPTLRPATMWPAENRDDGTDPPDGDLEGDPHTMLLGRIFLLDSPLTFESSPLHRQYSNSTGSLRLQKPGNETEPGGSERWEKIIEHPFTLVVKGILRYQLPIYTRKVSASLSGSVRVDPDESVPGKELVDVQVYKEVEVRPPPAAAFTRNAWEKQRKARQPRWRAAVDERHSLALMTNDTNS